MGKIIRKSVYATILILICLLCMGTRTKAASVSKSKNVSILLIGNSMVKRPKNYTATYLKNLCKYAGRKVTIDYVATSNEKLKNWANKKTSSGKKAYKKIASRKWNYIILQEHTDYAIAYGRTFLKASKTLAAYIKKKCPNAKIIYNCTWAYDKTVTINGKRYTYSKQRRNMQSNYKKVASATGGTICWSGKAFHAYRKLKRAKALYLADKNHATSYGWFLNASCMYATIFGASPEESSYTGGLNKTQIKKIKKIAWQQNK